MIGECIGCGKGAHAFIFIENENELKNTAKRNIKPLIWHSRHVINE
jgi:hypothetical protein